MNPESLPSALSDLFLPEVANPAGKSSTDRGGQGSSTAADVDRFEQYLSSARRSVMADQALPTPAATDEHLAARSDARRQPVDRTDRRQERSVTDRDDRRPLDDRATDAADRKDPVVDRDRTDRVDDDRRIDDADGPTRSDERGDAGSERGEVDEATDTDTTEGAAATTEESETETATDGAAASAAAGLATEIDLAVDGADTDVPVGAIDPTAESAAVELGSDTELDGGRDADAVGDEAETSLLDAQLDRATDPNTTAIAAAAASTDTDESDGADTDELAIDLDGEATADTDLVADEAGLLDGTDVDTDGEAELELDLTEGGGTTDGGSDDGAPGSERSTAEQTGGGQAATDGGVDDGPTVAPIAGPIASTNSGQTATTGQAVTGVDAVAGPAAPRNRTTTGPASTQAGQQAQAPLADGEAGDPLWLQVRRAMGSLRTLQNGEQQMTIRLRPAELGSVMVRVNAGENGTTVSLIADSAVAATQLTQQRQQLISELEQGGLAGVAVDVGTGAETDLRDGAAEDRDPSNESEGDGTAAAAAVAGASAGLPRTGGRGRRAGGSSGSLVDVEL